MSNYQQKPNTGALFVNKQRKTETHPEYTGTALINGVEMWVNGWINTSKGGEKYFNMTFNPKREQQEQPVQQYQQQGQPVEQGRPF